MRSFKAAQNLQRPSFFPSALLHAIGIAAEIFQVFGYSDRIAFRHGFFLLGGMGGIPLLRRETSQERADFSENFAFFRPFKVLPKSHHLAEMRRVAPCAEN